jgi:signal transduction histidine kinase
MKPILIVDDYASNRELLQDFLGTLGYESIGLTDGNAALEFLRTDGASLVLLDLQMPGMSGFEVLRQLEQTGQLLRLPVIIVSARNHESEITECIRLGAVDYLARPIDLPLLQARIESSLERFQLRARETEMRRNLEEKTRALEEVIAHRQCLSDMIVHDIGNSISVIHGYASLLLDQANRGPVAQDKAIRSVNATLTACADLENLTRGLLDVAKLEEGKMPVDRQKFRLSEVLERLDEVFQPIFKVRRASFRWELGAETDEICADQRLTGRILRNLLNNALKYSRENCEVHVSSEIAEGTVRLHVDDNGPGIPPPLRKRIFEKHFQISGPRGTGKKSGVGLGLTFCKMAMEAQGGAIAVASAPSGGARFTLSLPRCPSQQIDQSALLASV